MTNGGHPEGGDKGGAAKKGQDMPREKDGRKDVGASNPATADQARQEGEGAKARS